MLRVGAIGFGNRTNMVMRVLERMDEDVRFVAAWDMEPDFSRKVLARGDCREKPEDVKYYASPDEMLDKEALDGVIVGTRCSRHTEMACKVAARKLPLYLEKPVGTSVEQLRRLKAAFDKSQSPVVVSFPLRLTLHVEKVRQIIDAGEIGTVEHVQAINNVAYGHGYFKSWYRNYDETGGQWLQKATHDLDFVNFIMQQQPVLVAAMQSQRVFGLREPAGLTCDKCDKTETCPESPFSEFMRGDAQKNDLTPDKLGKCPFGVDATIEDNGSCLIEYAGGAHAVYSQNFFARRDAGYRGATVIGYKGTVQFDFYSDTVKLVKHHQVRTETIKIGGSDGHGGGDVELVRDFRNIMTGKGPSRAPLSAGIMSAFMCLKARASGQTKTFQPINLAERET